MCADSKFNNVVTACITADCTIKETLSMPSIAFSWSDLGACC